MTTKYFFRCCRELVSLCWKARTNSAGYIFVYRWTDRLIETRVPCVHPVVAVANHIKGYRMYGEADVDLEVAANLLALPIEFRCILNQAVERRECLPKPAYEVRLWLLDSLKVPQLFQPEPNAIRAPLIG